MPNILFDISVLGTGYYHPSGRTGVYRTIENLLEQLLLMPEYTIHLAATRSLVTFAKTESYLEAHHFKQGKLCPPRSAGLEHLGQLFARRIKGSTVGSSLGLRLLDQLLRVIPEYALLPAVGYQHTFDIVHATYYPLPSIRTAGQRRFATIYDLIPLLFPQLTRRSSQEVIKKNIKRITPDDWVITISEATKNDVCNYCHFDPRRIFVTPLAASRQFYRCLDTDELLRARRRYNIAEGPYILSLCTLEPRKNIPLLIHAFADLVLQERMTDLQLVLVGTAGWGGRTIWEEVKKWPELRGRIVTTGYVPDEDLAPLYSGALMFVYPSLYEGFGLPPLEAMQCGVPVITSNTSSLPEVVGGAGIMINPDDKQALCQAMLAIYRSPVYAEELATLSLDRASLFSWKRCAEATAKAYQFALESPCIS